ncbi:RNA exonuclease 5 [Caerostris darwini]|uniref:RNA exonuclease 5 n=1 Tax=Caerostris darwini TaxID=1538125 RepID=A0AAV4QYJ5_9ARAC|nr:RNA exonuclease 5 [Caerostris darwini]
MNSDPNKLTTWDIRKDQQFQAQKRKFETLFKKLDEDQNMSIFKKKKPENSFREKTCNSLAEQLLKLVKKPDVDVSFYLSFGGLKAQLDLKNLRTDKPVEPLFVEDVYQLLLKSVIGNRSPYPLNWAVLEQPQKISKTILLVIEDLTKSDIIENISKLNNVSDVFSAVVEILSSNTPFATELSTLHSITDFHIQSKDTYSSMFPQEKQTRIDASQNFKSSSKLHLMLSPIQMIMENYPFPAKVFQYSEDKGYVFTKNSYSFVTADSPLFALDCEMCRSVKDPKDLTRIAVVNENLEVVYETLVKPEAQIIDYMTKYSGITKEMLTDVNVKLSDVQKKLQTLLPPDAILCGQSLNCDLHALKMIHPYVIDTSIIFNTSGIRGKKVSLKNLALTYLNEVIQNNKKGHNPIEDAITAMKLVQLKLQNTIEFGDACLKNKSKSNLEASKINLTHTTSSIQNSPEKNNNEALIIKNTSRKNEGASSIINDDLEKSDGKASEVKVISNSKKIDDGFFSKVTKFSKKTCLIGNEKSLSQYDDNMLNDKVLKLEKSNREKIAKAVKKQIENNDLIISHLNFELTCEEDSIEKLNSILGQIYEACPDKTMFMVLVPGVDEKKCSDIKNGLFMTVLKKIN